MLIFIIILICILIFIIMFILIIRCRYTTKTRLEPQVTDVAPDLDPIKIQGALSTTRIGRRVIVRPVVSSTMDALGSLAHAGEPEGTVLVTDRQMSGRGRMGRSWLAPPGGSAGIEAPVCAAKLTQQRNAYYIVMAYVVMAYVVMAYIAAARLSLVGQRVGAGGLLKPSPLVVAEAHFELGLRHPLGSSAWLTAA